MCLTPRLLKISTSGGTFLWKRDFHFSAAISIDRNYVYARTQLRRHGAAVGKIFWNSLEQTNKRTNETKTKQFLTGQYFWVPFLRYFSCLSFRTWLPTICNYHLKDATCWVEIWRKITSTSETELHPFRLLNKSRQKKNWFTWLTSKKLVNLIGLKLHGN